MSDPKSALPTPATCPESYRRTLLAFVILLATFVISAEAAHQEFDREYLSVQICSVIWPLVLILVPFLRSRSHGPVVHTAPRWRYFIGGLNLQLYAAIVAIDFGRFLYYAGTLALFIAVPIFLVGTGFILASRTPLWLRLPVGLWPFAALAYPLALLIWDEARLQPQTILIPDGYLGKCHIDFAVPGGNPAPIEKGHVILRLDTTGHLATSFAPRKARDEAAFHELTDAIRYFYEDTQGHRRLLRRGEFDRERFSALPGRDILADEPTCAPAQPFTLKSENFEVIALPAQPRVAPSFFGGANN